MSGVNSSLGVIPTHPLEDQVWALTGPQIFFFSSQSAVDLLPCLIYFHDFNRSQLADGHPLLTLSWVIFWWTWQRTLPKLLPLHLTTWMMFWCSDVAIRAPDRAKDNPELILVVFWHGHPTWLYVQQIYPLLYNPLTTVIIIHFCTSSVFNKDKIN